jgi:hypothetical protein
MDPFVTGCERGQQDLVGVPPTAAEPEGDHDAVHLLWLDLQQT